VSRKGAERTITSNETRLVLVATTAADLIAFVQYFRRSLFVDEDRLEMDGDIERMCIVGLVF